MYGVDRWYYLGKSPVRHLMIAGSKPGFFRFACGRETRTVGPETFGGVNAVRRCKGCQREVDRSTQRQEVTPWPPETS